MKYHVVTGELDVCQVGWNRLDALKRALKKANCALGLLATVMEPGEEMGDNTKYFNTVAILKELGMFEE